MAGFVIELVPTGTEFGGALKLVDLGAMRASAKPRFWHGEDSGGALAGYSSAHNFRNSRPPTRFRNRPAKGNANTFGDGLPHRTLPGGPDKFDSIIERSMRAEPKALPISWVERELCSLVLFTRDRHSGRWSIITHGLPSCFWIIGDHSVPKQQCRGLSSLSRECSSPMLLAPVSRQFSRLQDTRKFVFLFSY